MKLRSAFSLLVVATGLYSSSLFSAPRATEPNYREITTKIAEEVLKRGTAYSNLKSFVAAGPRLCGSSGAAHAVEWAQSKLNTYGLDRVWLQPVRVPAWNRGDHESATVLSTATPLNLRVTALGNSAGTLPQGLEAEVIEVHSLKEAERLGAKLSGKIVFFNRPMDPTLADTFEAYGKAVDQRSAGPSLASKYGAVGALVRTMTTLTDDPHPHTGVTRFRAGIKPIPAAAISTHDANVLSKLLDANQPVRLHLELSAKTLPDTQSYNVIGEMTGSELSQEIVAVGGHLDSWDLAPAAHDDAAGVVQSLEVLRAFKALGIHPKRTVRVVLFMCEEFGGIGADEYANQAKLRGEMHLVATESDRGGYRATGFAVQDPRGRALKKSREWSQYLNLVQAGEFHEGESGTDVEPLAELGAATFGLLSDSKHYFDLHHSELDQVSAINESELNSGAAALALLTYLASEQGLSP